MAAPLGNLVSIGGGMMRYILSAEIPMVLRADLYAIVALAGAAVIVMRSPLHIKKPQTPPAMARNISGGPVHNIHFAVEAVLAARQRAYNRGRPRPAALGQWSTGADGRSGNTFLSVTCGR